MNNNTEIATVVNGWFVSISLSSNFDITISMNPKLWTNLSRARGDSNPRQPDFFLLVVKSPVLYLAELRAHYLSI